MTAEYLEPDDIQRMEDAADNHRDRLLIRLVFHLGCRISEALGLSVDDIDFESGKVTIVHLKSRFWMNCRNCGAKLGLKHEFCPRCGTKNELNSTERSERRRQRALPLDAETLATVKTFINKGGPVMRNCKLYLFGINRHRAWQIVRECARKAGLHDLRNPETAKTRGVSPHRLRDAFAVHAMKTDDSGEGMRLLQEHLGHANFNTTAKYRKVSGKEHHDWYEKLWQGKG